MVAMVVIVVAVIKVLVWTGAVVGRIVVTEVLFIDVWTDLVIKMLAAVGIIVVAAVIIILEFEVPMTCFVCVLSDDALINVLTSEKMGFVPSIAVEVLADANANVFASLVTALEFAVTKP